MDEGLGAHCKEGQSKAESWEGGRPGSHGPREEESDATRAPGRQSPAPTFSPSRRKSAQGCPLPPRDTRALEKAAGWAEDWSKAPKPKWLCACAPPHRSLPRGQNLPCRAIVSSKCNTTCKAVRSGPGTHPRTGITCCHSSADGGLTIYPGGPGEPRRSPARPQ